MRIFSRLTKKKFINFISISVLPLLLTSCASQSISYLSKEDISSPSFDNYKSKTLSHSNYGALKVKNSDNPYEKGRVIMLNRKGNKYYSETLFRKNKETRYFISLGLDYSERNPLVGFRVEY